MILFIIRELVENCQPLLSFLSLGILNKMISNIFNQSDDQQPPPTEPSEDAETNAILAFKLRELISSQTPQPSPLSRRRRHPSDVSSFVFHS